MDAIFINLPVRDVAAATAFYKAIGMIQEDRFSAPHASAMAWSDSIRVMLLAHDFYATFTPKRIIDAHRESGVLLALSRASRTDVDALTEAALAAGGREAHPAEDLGYMYSRAFEDLDGHGWGPFFMDMEAAMASMGENAPQPA